MKSELEINQINQKKLYMFLTLAQLVEESPNHIDIEDLYSLIKEYLEKSFYSNKKIFS